MQLYFETKYHQIEEKQWWSRSRRDIILKLLEKEPKAVKILELGCSSGILIKDLNKRGFSNVSGIDISKNAIELCKKRGLSNCSVMEATNLDFKDKSIDILIASDILEHIEDDEKAIKEWDRVLKTGGKLIIFVPALEWMWSIHDEINEHFRRYTKSRLRDLLIKNRLKIERISYWNASLFFPAAITRISKRNSLNDSREKDQFYRIPDCINNVLFHFVRTENWLLTKINLPIGVSIFTIAKK